MKITSGIIALLLVAVIGAATPTTLYQPVPSGPGPKPTRPHFSLFNTTVPFITTNGIVQMHNLVKFDTTTGRTWLFVANLTLGGSIGWMEITNIIPDNETHP